jgi:hypothetical protein
MRLGAMVARRILLHGMPSDGRKYASMCRMSAFFTSGDRHGEGTLESAFVSAYRLTGKDLATRDPTVAKPFHKLMDDRKR